MDDGRPVYFPEPAIPDRAWGRYGEAARQVDWLHRSTLTQAIRIREFLNRSLGALPVDAAANLAHRLRHDPPFGRVFFELVVGRFLQVLGADVEHQPTGLGGVNVDWRATFRSGETVLVEATSPVYNLEAYRERLRREALVGVIEDAAPGGWWIHPDELPALGLHDARGAFKRVVRTLLSDLPDPAGYSSENKLRREGSIDEGPVVLELWPGRGGRPTGSPIAFVSMGAHVDDSPLRVAVAARAKRHQARAFPGEAVLLAIDAPFGGPDVESYDVALFGSTVMRLSLEGEVAGYSFRRDGALVRQRQAEYAGVLAFPRVGMFGAIDPIVYHHPRFGGSLPAELVDLRHRFLEDGKIRDVAAQRTGIVDAIGFPVPGDDD